MTLRFTILRHVLPEKSRRRSHFDLMLQRGDALWTWEIEALPMERCALRARRLPDHRLDYLDYVGPVTGDRGWVSQVDSGTLHWHCEEADRLEASIEGQLCRGRLTLIRRLGGYWELTLVADSTCGSGR